MTKSREQRAAVKKVDAAHKKALVAFADCETAKDDFTIADAVAKNAKDVARKAKSDARKADAVYFEAVKSSLAIDKAAYVAGKKGAKTTTDQTSYPKDDDDNDAYVCDENGTPYFHP